MELVIDQAFCSLEGQISGTPSDYVVKVSEVQALWSVVVVYVYLRLYTEQDMLSFQQSL